MEFGGCFLGKDVPMTPGGVGVYGVGLPTRWTFSTYGNFMSVYGIRNHVSMIFNLKNVEDIENKMKVLYKMRDDGCLDNDDLQELEERLRTMSDLSKVGNEDYTRVAIEEGKKHRKGQKYYTYSDGKRVEHIARGPMKKVSQEKLRAIENARRYAHTPEADKKRRKSINARGEGKDLGI